MAQITITIPDNLIPRIQAAFTDPMTKHTPTPTELATQLKAAFVNDIVMAVSNYEASVAEQIARNAANSAITIT